LTAWGKLILFRGCKHRAGMVRACSSHYRGHLLAIDVALRWPVLGGVGRRLDFRTDARRLAHESWSWRACFWVNLPVGAIAVTAIYLEFPNMKPRRDQAPRLVGIREFDRLRRTLLLAHVGDAIRLELLVSSAAAFATLMLGAFLFVDRIAGAMIRWSCSQSGDQHLLGLCVRARHGHVRRDIYLRCSCRGCSVSRDAVGQSADTADDGAVLGSFASGRRCADGKYKAVASPDRSGRRGMILFADMNDATTRTYVASA